MKMSTVFLVHLLYIVNDKRYNNHQCTSKNERTRKFNFVYSFISIHAYTVIFLNRDVIQAQVTPAHHPTHLQTEISTHLKHKEMRQSLSAIKIEEILAKIILLLEGRNPCCTGNHPTLHCTPPVTHQPT